MLSRFSFMGKVSKSDAKDPSELISLLPKNATKKPASIMLNNDKKADYTEAQPKFVDFKNQQEFLGAVMVLDKSIRASQRIIQLYHAQNNCITSDNINRLQTNVDLASNIMACIAHSEKVQQGDYAFCFALSVEKPLAFNPIKSLGLLALLDTYQASYASLQKRGNDIVNILHFLETIQSAQTKNQTAVVLQN